MAKVDGRVLRQEAVRWLIGGRNDGEAALDGDRRSFRSADVHESRVDAKRSAVVACGDHAGKGRACRGAVRHVVQLADGWGRWALVGPDAGRRNLQVVRRRVVAPGLRGV